MKIAIITPGFSPVPAVKGGAIENLIQMILNENEKKNKLEIDLLGVYDEKAFQESIKYKNTNFVYFKTCVLIRFLDKFIYFIVKNILRKSNLISYRYMFSRISTILSYLLKIKKNNYNKLILVGNPTLFILLRSRKVRKRYNKKIIYWAHNEIKNMYGCEKYLYVLDKFIAVSNFVIKKFNDIYNTKKEISVFVLKNCVELKNIEEIDRSLVSYYRNKYNLNNDERIILFTGRISAEKGVKEVIEAFQLLRKNNPNIKLIIVGANFYAQNLMGSYEKEVHKMVASDDNIIVTGYVEYNNVFSLYKLADIAVLPSMWDEPAGMTMLELSLMGVPVITTNSGGIPEYIDQNSGILLNRENIVNQIVEAVDLLLKEKNMYKMISENSKELKKIYNSERFYENFLLLVKH